MVKAVADAGVVEMEIFVLGIFTEADDFVLAGSDMQKGHPQPIIDANDQLFVATACGADQGGLNAMELTTDDAHTVTSDQAGRIGGVGGKTVFVSTGYPTEVLHGGIGEEREPFALIVAYTGQKVIGWQESLHPLDFGLGGMDEDIIIEQRATDILFAAAKGAHLGVAGGKKIKNRFAFCLPTIHFGLQFGRGMEMSTRKFEYIPAHYVAVFPIGYTLFDHAFSNG